MLLESHGQVNSCTWEATLEQSPHHDAAMPEAGNSLAVPSVNPRADVLTQSWPIPVPMEVPDAHGWDQHPGPQEAAPAPVMP